MSVVDEAPMSARMRKFLANPPKRITDAAVAARANKCVRRAKPKGWLAELCDMQRWQCAYCNRHMRKKVSPKHPGREATLDHVLPISRGGRNQWGNLVAACLSCNKAKGSMTGDEFRASRKGGDSDPD